MAVLHVFILFYAALGFLPQGFCLISDHKLCGDQECASMLSHVRAQRDHTAPDCHFLSFKKGDMITVYYKLTGKRSDLWAGSIDKLFGLFPKDAVNVEQRFIDEKQEIQVPTQEFDFYCIDENGSVIDINTEFDDLEDLTPETQAEIHNTHDKRTDTENSDPSQISAQDVSDHNNPKATEKGGSSWIGSAVSGLFGRDEQSNGVTEPQDGGSDQEHFKSRKIAMNIEQNHIDEKTNPGTLGWISGGLTKALGYKDSKPDTQDNTENPTKDKEPSSPQSSSWLSVGIDVLGLGKDNTKPVETKPETEAKDENIDMEEKSIFTYNQSLDSAENVQKVENEDHTLLDIKLEDDTTEQKKTTGWYGRIYNGISDLYSKEESVSEDDDEDSLSEKTPNTKGTENKESESSSNSMFSVNRLSSVLDKFKFPFQSEASVKSDVEGDNEATTHEEVSGKEQHQPSETSETSDTDEPDKAVTLNDITASESQPAANFMKENIQSENYSDSVDKELKQNLQRNVRNEDEKRRETAEELDSGQKEVFQASNPKDLISETQEPFHEEMTLNSDDIRTLHDSSQTVKPQRDDTRESKDSETTEIQAADHLNEAVIQSRKHKAELNVDILEGELKQSPSDQENDSDTVKQRGNDDDDIISSAPSRTDPVTGSDPDDVHTHELSEPSLQTGTELDQKQISVFAESGPDFNAETINVSQRKDADSKVIVETLSHHNDAQILAGGDTEINDDSSSMLDTLITGNNETELDGAPEEITNEEILSDLETEINSENELNRGIISPDEGQGGYSDELVKTKEINPHSDLQSEANLVSPTIDKKMENPVGPHDGLFEMNKADISIKGTESTIETKSEDGHPDEVIEEKHSLFSTSAETKDLNTSLDSETHPDASKQNDIQMQNENVSQTASTKEEHFINISDGENTVSKETKLIKHLFAGSDPQSVQKRAQQASVQADAGQASVQADAGQASVQADAGQASVQADAGQASVQNRAEQKENTDRETDTVNNEEDPKTESVTDLQHQTNDVDMIKTKASHTQDRDISVSENKPTQKQSKEYTNLHPHLTEDNIKELLQLFGEHKLSWLDSKLGVSLNTNAGQENDFDELNNFKQLLQNHIKMRIKPRDIQNPDVFPDQDKTNENPALQKLFIILSSLGEIYTPGKTKVKVDESAGSSQESLNTNTLTITQEVDSNAEDTPDVNGLNPSINLLVSQERDVSTNTITEDLHVDFHEINQQINKHKDFEIKKTTSQLNHGLVHEENVTHEELQNGAEQLYQLVISAAEVTMSEFRSAANRVVASLPDDIRPGPDLYGLPWEAVVFTGLLGLFTLLLFSCRFMQSIKSRFYASREKQMAEKVAELLDEKCKVLETYSEVKQKYEKLEASLQNCGTSAQIAEKENLEATSQKLEQSNAQMKRELEQLQEDLTQQNKARKEQKDQLDALEQMLRNLEEETKERKSQLEQDNTTLKIHAINTERLQKNLQAAKEEQELLLESKAQLVQEAEGWNERLVELEEEMKMCARSHGEMMEDCTNKDERIKSLTNCLLKMKDWDSEDETSIDSTNNTAGTENGDTSDFSQKQKVQKLIEAAKMSADLKSMEEDKNRVFAKLKDEMKAKEDLQEGIKQLEEEKEMLESDSARYSSESQKLQQKLQIMTEMYQENELKLHRMLTVEEKERLQKEEKLNKAGKKISLAAEELNTYRQRAKDLEEELERTSQAYKNQISSHEKKAHDNWLAARAADRDLADVKRENALLRQRLTDSQFKLEILEKDPYVRDGRPLFRGERSPYGPSPLGRPSSETRAFLSPPTLMDGPPRLSPQFPMGPGGRASRGVVEPPSGGRDFERSGPHSDSGSLSPSWDRDRRGPPGPSGPPLPDPFRRVPAGPYPAGPLPLRPSLPPEPYFDKSADSSFLRNSSAVSENEGRDGSHSVPGDMRIPPDPDSRMVPLPRPLLMGMPPPMDPRDPLFSHRGPYGPPEFFPPRGPGGPPIGMRGPLPPGMFPRGPLPLPQHMGYLPPRPPPDSFPPGPPPRPSPPGSEQPPEQSASPHDVI